MKKSFLFTLIFFSCNSFAYIGCEKYINKRKTWETEDMEKLSLVAYISGAYDLYTITHSRVRRLEKDLINSYLNCLEQTTMEQRFALIDTYCTKNKNDPLWLANYDIFFELSEACINKIDEKESFSN